MSSLYPVTGRYSVIYGNPFLLFRKRKGEGMNATPNLQGVVPFNGKTDLLTPFTFAYTSPMSSIVKVNRHPQGSLDVSYKVRTRISH